jgi:hypothetical protein
MPPVNPDEYGRALMERAGEAQRLLRAEVRAPDWEPQPNRCHENVTIWCESNQGYVPVRGWLFFDLPGLPHARFVAHSAVRTPDGQLYDITPSNAMQEYPFLEAQLSEEDFADLVEGQGRGQLDPRKPYA